MAEEEKGERYNPFGFIRLHTDSTHPSFASPLYPQSLETETIGNDYAVIRPRSVKPFLDQTHFLEETINDDYTRSVLDPEQLPPIGGYHLRKGVDKGKFDRFFHLTLHPSLREDALPDKLSQAMQKFTPNQWASFKKATVGCLPVCTISSNEGILLNFNQEQQNGQIASFGDFIVVIGQTAPLLHLREANPPFINEALTGGKPFYVDGRLQGIGTNQFRMRLTQHPYFFEYINHDVYIGTPPLKDMFDIQPNDPKNLRAWVGIIFGAPDFAAVNQSIENLIITGTFTPEQLQRIVHYYCRLEAV